MSDFDDLVYIDEIRKDPTYMAKIENPTQQLQLAAICFDPRCILYIKDPSENTQTLAGEMRPHLIHYMSDPEPYTDTLRRVFSRNPSLIETYDRPISDEAKLTIIANSPSCILFFNRKESLTYDMIWKAVYTAPDLFFNIMCVKDNTIHIDKELILLVIKRSWELDTYSTMMMHYCYLYLGEEYINDIEREVNKSKLTYGPMD